MKLLSLLGLCMLSCFACVGGQEGNDGWSPVFKDDFNREMIGPNWCWVFGDGRKYIRENAIHISHSATVYCLVPLPYQDSRVELDLLLPSNSFSGTHAHAISLSLRGGEVGGGGKNERFEAIFIPESEKAGAVTNPDGTAKDIDPNTIVPMAIDQN